ncbi:hypothetical protein C4564_00995 [Candidatus Microgenomates bacterium]|nr:MAG: hypothetical protein C4564_00995 [Candidatus Microgenomates bacterium]
MKALKKIDQFYYFLAIALVVVSAVAIVGMRSIFEAARTAGQVDEALLQSSVPHVDKLLLESAINKINNKEIVPLDLKD